MEEDVTFLIRKRFPINYIGGSIHESNSKDRKIQYPLFSGDANHPDPYFR